MVWDKLNQRTRHDSLGGSVEAQVQRRDVVVASKSYARALLDFLDRKVAVFEVG